MRPYFVLGASGIALLASIAIADAQTVVTREVELSPAQRTIIYERVTRQAPAVVMEPGVELRVGARIPRSVRVYEVPDTVVTEVPAIRRYRYMHVNDQLVLVDPETSEVVEIIRP
jgi:hypothetical protein